MKAAAAALGAAVGDDAVDAFRDLIPDREDATLDGARLDERGHGAAHAIVGDAELLDDRVFCVPAFGQDVDFRVLLFEEAFPVHGRFRF